MKNTDFMNLSLPEGTDKIDVEILNNDFKKLESEASKHYIKQQIEVDGTATIIGSIGPYVQLENLTDNILNVRIGDELVILTKGDNRKIRTISGENYGVVTSGAVRITYYINAQTYADENFYKKEKVDELLQNVEATVEVDAELSETSENPVQNKVITAEFANYATTAEVESKVTEKVAELVAGAPEDFDTLKEMSDWLKEHEDSAASMNSAIQKNAEDIATANTNITKNASDISAANTAIKKNKTDIATANTNIQKNVDDISSVNVQITDMYNRCVGGKNLAKLSTSPAAQMGVTVTTNQTDGTVTVEGELTSGDFAYFIVGRCTLIAGVTYMLIDTSFVSGMSYCYLNGNNKEFTKSGTLYTPAENQTLLIYYRARKSITYNNVHFPMIVEKSVVDKTFVPYIPTNKELQAQTEIHETETKSQAAVSRTTLGVQCKNLLNFTGNTTTTQGITFTVNEDKSITVSGKNTETTAVWYWVKGTRNVPMDIFEVGRSYIVSGTPADNLDITGTKLAQIRVEKNITVIAINKAGKDTKFTINSSNIPEYITIYVSAGADFTDKPITFYPMIREADITDNTYEPYKPSLQEQLNSLLARIATLEGATATTEGGE